MMGIIKRTFTFLDKDIFNNLYKALVRHHLEYGNVRWSPYLKRQSVRIDKSLKGFELCRETEKNLIDLL